MDKDALAAALAGLTQGVIRLAQLAGGTLPSYLTDPISDPTLARLQFAQRISPAGGAQASRSVETWPHLTSVLGQLHEFASSAVLRPQRLAFDAQIPVPIEPGLLPAGQTAYADCTLMAEDLKQVLQSANHPGDPHLRLEALLNVLQEFGWAVTADRDSPEVSLYDQTRITAALAAALAVDGRSADWCLNAKEGDAVCTLVLGDVNGVQDFIYSIASRGAAKTLRGRSFYIQLLTEVVAEYILDALGLPLTNLLYAGGGNFHLIVGAEQVKEWRNNECPRGH